MTYTNSSLVGYIDRSPNYNKRRATDKINRLTIHHMAGSYGVETCGRLFHQKLGSSNYGIDPTKIALYVDECNRAWTSSNGDNDYRAVTIEVANTQAGVQFGTWEIADESYGLLITLSADICQRNGLNKVIEISDDMARIEAEVSADVKAGKVKSTDYAKERVKRQTAYANAYVVPEGTCLMTQHYNFAATVCPGPYIQKKWKQICSDINALLNGQPYVPPKPEPIIEVAKPTLRKGNQGAQVRLLQQNLISLGYSVGKWGCDGIFGDSTRSAVIAFQKKAFPTQSKEWDGIYGNKTYAKLREVLVNK